MKGIAGGAATVLQEHYAFTSLPHQLPHSRFIILVVFSLPQAAYRGGLPLITYYHYSPKKYLYD